MSDIKIRLNGRQIEFLVRMLEIKDTTKAMQRFAEIMVEERLSPKEMSKVIDIIIEKMKAK